MQRATIVLPLLAGLITLVGCVTRPEFRAEAVKAYEYRYFPEYGGYLPIQTVTNLGSVSPAPGRTGIVRANWVVPVKGPDGKPDYTPPANQEEAELRVKQTGRRERELSPIVTLPAGVVLGSVLWTFGAPLVVVPLTGVALSEHIKKKSVEITLCVTNADGRPLSGARVWEIPTPLACPFFTNGTGRRSFAPPHLHPFEVSSNAAALFAEHLPIRLGRGNFPGMLPEPGLRDEAAGRADARGQIRYTSIALARASGAWQGDSVASWTTTPPSLQLHLLVWAPGFAPQVVTTPAVRPKDHLRFAVMLQPLPDCAHIARAAAALDEVPERMDRAIRPSFWARNAYKVNAPQVRALADDLERWARDETLPGYLRWNAVHSLDRLSSLVPAKQKALLAEVKAVWVRTEPLGASLSPYLSDTAPNPWHALRETSKLLSPPTRPSLDESTRERARTVLAEGEAALPGLPCWDNLRAVLALAEGDRARAAALAASLDHHQFFRLFYGLEVQPEPVKGGLGE